MSDKQRLTKRWPKFLTSSRKMKWVYTSLAEIWNVWLRSGYQNYRIQQIREIGLALAVGVEVKTV